jgi:monoterpene epsilon-lactone hydrolase
VSGILRRLVVLPFSCSVQDVEMPMKLMAAPIFLLALSTAVAQQATGTTAAQAPNTDTSYIDADGTAHVTRVIPVPQDLSPEAKKSL